MVGVAKTEDDDLSGMGRSPAWVVPTLAALGQACGVSETTVQNWKRKPGFPGGENGYNLYEVAKWRTDRELTNKLAQRTRLAGDRPDDPLLAAGSSPNLELYRGHKATLAGFEVEKERKNLLVRETTLEWLMDMAAILRRACDLLQRRFGPEAYGIIESALRDVEVMIRSRFGASSEDNSDDRPG